MSSVLPTLSHPWVQVVTGSRGSNAAAVARDVATRATDPELIGQALAAASGQTRYPQTLRREGYGIASGDAGLAILCAAYDRVEPDFGWDRIAHGYITSAVRSAERTTRLPPSLFAGVSGLAFAVHDMSRDGRRYERLLDHLDAELACAVAEVTEVVRCADPVPTATYDVISGLSGVVVYLLRRDSRVVLPDVLRSLTHLAASRPGLPLWATPADWLDDAAARRRYPRGSLNCGLAHGIPGVLAALALAVRSGHEVEGQVDAVRGLADWLVAQRTEDAWGIDWPGVVPVDSAGRSDAAATSGGRAGWCYGGPGVSRALWHAAEALDDESLRQVAHDGVLAAVRRPVPLRGIPSPTLCHGIAGTASDRPAVHP